MYNSQQENNLKVSKWKMQNKTVLPTSAVKNLNWNIEK
jgi:hypothetical protein